MSVIKNGYIFIHIPKTAGTSIESIIGGSGHGTIKNYLESKDKNGIIGENIPFISFVRNPYDRLVSAHSNITQLGEVYANANNIPTIPSFESVVKNLDVFGDITFNIPHFYPQHYFIEYEGKLKCDRVYKFENLYEDFNRMKKEFNINGELPHHQKSNHKDYKDYYNEELAEITYEFYKKDFELFNYDKEL